jgi:hypothetical protein
MKKRSEAFYREQILKEGSEPEERVAAYLDAHFDADGYDSMARARLGAVLARKLVEECDPRDIDARLDEGIELCLDHLRAFVLPDFANDVSAEIDKLLGMPGRRQKQPV